MPLLPSRSPTLSEVGSSQSVRLSYAHSSKTLSFTAMITIEH